MTLSTSRTTASWQAVVAAQIRAVGIALRPTLVVAGSALLVLTLSAALAALRDGEGIEFVPNFALLTALGGLLLPGAVWRSEYHLHRSYLASLPIDRAGHAFIKLMAGWAWLMVLTVTFIVGMILLALVTGGAIGTDETRVLLADVPLGATSEEAASYARRWTTPSWHWMVFFTVTTVAYLLGSAVVLAGSRVRRWLGGIVVLVLFWLFLAEQGFGFGGVETWVADNMEALAVGPYGLVALLGAPLSLTLVDSAVPVWREVTVTQWLLTTLLWMTGALMAILVVVRRKRDI